MKRTFLLTTFVSIFVTLLLGFGSVVTVTAQTPSSNPILLVVNDDAPNVFGRYYGEILRAEGLSQYDVAAVDTISAASLAAYPVVILSETPLTAPQATAFSSYVTGGGYLIAMRPDAQIKGLFGLNTLQGTQSDGYLALNGTGPSASLPTATLQIHGTVNKYTPAAGAVSLASLYSDATTATSYPAVLQNATGHAVAFNYDLARSIILMRQGNPANADVDTDHDNIPRTIDLFQGATTWVDLNKVPIPQADVQQRFFARLITQAISAKQPTPQMWYFPDTHKTMMILTGDAHANPTDWYQAEIDFMNTYNAKMTFYLSISSLSETNLQAWHAQGHEFGIHPPFYKPDSYEPFDIENLSQGYDVYTRWFPQQYPSIPMSLTVRNHQVAWKGWTTAAEYAVSHGLEMDANFYNWGPWLQKPDSSWAHGYITGSGQPMKFIKADGTILPYYQQLTQLVDEQMFQVDEGYTAEGLDTAGATVISKQLIDASEAGDYAALMTQFHVDYFSETQGWIGNTLTYAQSKNIPLWNADQWLAFTKARHDANYTNVDWDNTTHKLTFNMVAAATAGMNLSTMLPPTFKDRTLLSVKVDNAVVPISTQTINGIDYDFVTVPAGNHSFTADYNSDLPGAAPIRNYYTALPITLTWGTVSTATQYEVQVSSTNNFALPLAYDVVVPASSLSATITTLADNTYYWRVRAQSNGVWSAWSAVDQFMLKTQ